MAEPNDLPTDSELASRAAVSLGSNFLHLARAPIQEALIYFRTALPPQFDPGVFRALFRTERMASYAQMDETRNFEQTVQFDPKSGSSSSGSVKDRGLDKVVFRSADQLNFAQFRRDGFVFSRLRPYTSWEAIFSEAWRLWQIYREVAAPAELSRIGTRFINRMSITLDSNDLRLYLHAPPLYCLSG